MGINRLVTCSALALLLVLVQALPAIAASAQLAYETVNCGWLAEQDNTDHPKKVTLYQVVSSRSFNGLTRLAIAVGYERLDDTGSPGSGTLGKITGQVQLVQDNGQKIFLGKVKGKRDTAGSLLGLTVVELPVAIQQGDVLEWTIKLKGFAALSRAEDFEILGGIGLPEMLDE